MKKTPAQVLRTRRPRRAGECVFIGTWRVTPSALAVAGGSVLFLLHSDLLVLSVSCCVATAGHMLKKGKFVIVTIIDIPSTHSTKHISFFYYSDVRASAHAHVVRRAGAA